VSQTIETIHCGRWISNVLPDPDEEVMPGVPWGRIEALFTPAYWASQAWLEDVQQQDAMFRLGETLVEEVAACLLGGHGIPAEVGIEAFRRLRSRGLLQGEPGIDSLRSALTEPLYLRGRPVRYRFASQKAHYLHVALGRINTRNALDTLTPIALRSWLMNLPGVGPKTASWIVRNWYASDDVAILDVHVLRAGRLIGLFPERASLPRDYIALESQYLRFARAIGVGAAKLDALIWMHMREAPRSVRDSFAGTNQRRSRTNQSVPHVTKQLRKPRVPRRSKQAERESKTASYQPELPL
jgi:thermostable 8-oxoguanine DNA glycosylase